MSISKGFTLIELVIVIVILGILAATAVPKFINLQPDTKTATLKTLKGSIESALDMAFSRLTVNDLQNKTKQNKTKQNKTKQNRCLFFKRTQIGSMV